MTDTPQPTYNSRALLVEPCLDGVYRQIGVTVGEPLQGEVEIVYETISIHTSLCHEHVPALEARTATHRLTAGIVADLERVIAALSGHRDRLTAELERLGG